MSPYWVLFRSSFQVNLELEMLVYQEVQEGENCIPKEDPLKQG